MKNKIIKIGFDLDGVILYNPIRIVRPIVTFVKNIFFKKPEVFTYFPKSKFEKFLWSLAHKTSFFISPGFLKIKELANNKNVEIYLVTSRFSFLKKDLDDWIKKINGHIIFKQYFYNQKDERAHYYKERLIKKLDLDFFVEDNLDIVNHLNKTTKTKILWIYNILDRREKYDLKYSNLKSAVLFIEKSLRKKKVLIVTDYFYPHWTGLSKSFYNLTSALENEFDITVLTVKYKQGLKIQENIGRIKIIRTTPLFSLSRVKYSFSLIQKFVSLVKSYDVTLINSPFSNILPLSIITKIFRKKLLIFHQGDLILPKGPLNWLIERAFDFLTKGSLLLADKTATYSQDYAEHSRVLNKFLYKFTPLLLPVRMPKIESLLKIKRLENLKKEKIIFGFAGRFVEEKGFDILLRAIPQVVEKIPNAHFVFAGETKMGYENFFEKNKSLFLKSKQRITFLGLLNDKEMAAFYKTINYLIAPSRSDCFNYVQAESMLSKTPSIVADIPGLRYVVQQTGFGVLFKPENPEDLTEKTIGLIKNQNSIITNYKKVLFLLDDKKIIYKIKEFLK